MYSLFKKFNKYLLNFKFFYKIIILINKFLKKLYYFNNHFNNYYFLNIILHFSHLTYSVPLLPQLLQLHVEQQHSS